jgi:hypothetical protein
MGAYYFIIAESYLFGPRGDKGEIRVRPIPDQIFPVSMNVECSKKMRHNHPIGTKFKIKVKVTELSETNTKFLYCYYNWPYEIVK